MDTPILLWLNDWVGRWGALDAAIKVLVSDYFVPVLEALCLFGLWFYGQGKGRLANQVVTITGAIAIGFANAVTIIINRNYFRPRPFADLDLHLLFYRPTDGSFPANAAAVGFAIATAVYLTHRRLGLALYALAFLWALARVIAGVHYPSDAVGGAVIGVGAGAAAALAARLISPITHLVLGLARRLFLV